MTGKPLRRRSLLAGLAGTATLGAAGCPASRRTTAPEVRFVGQTPERGHLLRDGALRSRPAQAVLKTRVLVVGGGAAGTSAAWRMHRAGFDDFLLVELEDSIGGTALGGETQRTAYPMGAHYLPAPHPEFSALQAALEDVGAILGREANGAPHYDPTISCASPLERHRHRGRWFEGIYPQLGETDAEAAQWEKWRAHLQALGRRRGADGRRLFALPVEASSNELRHLATVSMATYLDRLGITSWRCRWTIDYACRDDYGCTLAQASAFAGLHHFLSRGLEDTHHRPILAWPGGNGDLIAAMATRSQQGDRRRTGLAVVGVDPALARARAYDVAAGEVIEIQAEQILWAAPRFVLRHCLDPGADPLPAGALLYVPWLVANVAVDRRPGGVGAALAWDNVAIKGDHLGYVVATHNEGLAGRNEAGSVLSFYQPFAADSASGLARARQELLSAPPAALGEAVVQRLEGMHPGIRDTVKTIDLARWGHAMVRSGVGVLFSENLAAAAAPIGRVRPCAADVGGLPLFEQAFANGITAAESALAALGHPVADPLIPEVTGVAGAG